MTSRRPSAWRVPGRRRYGVGGIPMKALRALPIVLLVGALVAAADARKRDDSSKVRRARGEVTDVRPGDNQFTLRTRDGKELKFDMDRDAQVRIDGRASDLAGLKKGMRVVV